MAIWERIGSCTLHALFLSLMWHSNHIVCVVCQIARRTLCLFPLGQCDLHMPKSVNGRADRRYQARCEKILHAIEQMPIMGGE